MSKPDILITGAGASGGFLMTRLMTAFKGYRGVGAMVGQVFSVHSREFFSEERKPYFGRGLARKADHTYLLCDCFPPWEEEQANRMHKMKEDGDLIVVHIIRNGFDVLRSRPTKRVAEIWCGSMRQYFDYQDVPNITVRYEELCFDPDRTQDAIEKFTGLEIEHKFSEYPKWLAAAYKHGVKRSHDPRPIDAKRCLGGNSEPIALSIELSGKKKEFYDYMERLNYA
jgi:hypothetical protein